MYHISTSLSLFLKLILPTMWTVFFGMFTLAVYWIDIAYIGPVPVHIFRMGVTLFLMTGLALLYWSVMRLKRVDIDKKFIYVTNYFKTYRYPYHQIARVRQRDYYFFRAVDIYLNEPGQFDQPITFVASRSRFDAFMEKHPEWREAED